MGLENTFYIIGIICMSLITLILIALIVLVVIIKAKITHLQHSLQDKIRPVTNLVNGVEDAAQQAVKKAKKVFKK
jgi:Sec-independent protein translocase protein TatA